MRIEAGYWTRLFCATQSSLVVLAAAPPSIPPRPQLCRVWPIRTACTFTANQTSRTCILPKVVGEFLLATFAELQTKRTKKGDELTSVAARRKSPYWCALHDADDSKWDKKFREPGKLRDMVVAAVTDPDGFLESHDASSPTYLPDQMSRRRTALSKQVSSLSLRCNMQTAC